MHSNCVSTQFIRRHRKETLFGRTVTPAERLRQNQRAITKAQRELDRERNNLEKQEKKLVQDIRKGAKAGQMVLLILLVISAAHGLV